jgi:transposase InsO family protein
MEKLARRRYTLEYKQEAVRLVSSGQRVAAAAKALGIVEQTLANWVKAEKAGQLRGMVFKNHREAKDAPLEWLLWYNGSRMHSTLRYLSPVQFEQQAIAQRCALAA